MDELVHEVMSKRASAINNAGDEAQVDFLLGEGLKVRDIVPAIEGNILRVEYLDGTVQWERRGLSTHKRYNV